MSLYWPIVLVTCVQMPIIHNGHGWKCEPCSGNPKTLVPLLMQQRGYRHTELKTVVEKTMYQIMVLITLFGSQAGVHMEPLIKENFNYPISFSSTP